jgi:carboxymethylenebutenolidase
VKDPRQRYIAGVFHFQEGFMRRRSTLSLATVVLVGACTLQRSAPSAPAFSRSSALAVTGAGSSSSMSADEHMAHMSAADMAAPVATYPVAQQNPALPASNNGAADRVKNSPRHGEWVKIAYEPGSADSLMAWVVYPFSKTASQKAPVVVVVHEIFGLSTWVRGVADQVAADGFIAVAPQWNCRPTPRVASFRVSAPANAIRSSRPPPTTP